MQSTQLRPPEVEPMVARLEGDGDGRHRAHDHGHSDEVDLNVPEPRRGWVAAVGVVALLALAALLVVGLVPRHRQDEELRADAAAAVDAPVPVNVVRPRRAATVVDLPLPGTLRPWQEVSIFARTNGYLKKYYVDISNPVEKGQLLAEIDTPEV